MLKNWRADEGLGEQGGERRHPIDDDHRDVRRAASTVAVPLETMAASAAASAL